MADHNSKSAASSHGTQITIFKGYEHRTVHFSDIYDPSAFFSEQYAQAACCIDEIVSQSDLALQQTGESYRIAHEINGSRFGNSELMGNATSRIMGYSNNIIALCGRRGHGKTSLMLSLANALQRLRLGQQSTQCERFWNRAHQANHEKTVPGQIPPDEKSPVLQKQYYIMAAIDPTTMSPGDSVINVIIHKLFNHFQDFLSRDRNTMTTDRSKIEVVLNHFRAAFNSLGELKKVRSNWQSGELADLASVGDNVEMRINFSRLVASFLSIMGYDMLVIQVDDADLDPSRAFVVSEDIRKFCVVPQVIVLMALHMSTLRRCVEQEYIKRYMHLLREDLSIRPMESYKCAEMAERYIAKLIPSTHQVHLPHFDKKIEESSDSYELHYHVILPRKDVHLKRAQYDLLVRQNGKQTASALYADRLFRLIYEKTGVILMGCHGYLHNFLPVRYRELGHFLSFFTSLDDIDVQGKGSLSHLLKTILNINASDQEHEQALEYIQLRLRNLDHLETYFLQHWCASVLTKHQTAQIEEIINAPRGIKHRRTLECLKDYCSSPEKRQQATAALFDNPAWEKNTYGAVMYVLDRLKTHLDVPSKYQFLYAVKLYYAIYLNKLMCWALMDSARKDSKQSLSFDDILGFIGTELFAGDAERFSPAEEKYQIISAKLLRFLLQSSIPSSYTTDGRLSLDNRNVKFLNFCVPYKEKLSDILVSDGRGKWDLAPQLQQLKFSFGNAILMLLNPKTDESTAARSNSGPNQDSPMPASSNRYDQQSDNINKNAYWDPNIISSALQVICNYDVQRRLEIVFGERNLIMADHSDQDGGYYRATLNWLLEEGIDGTHLNQSSPRLDRILTGKETEPFPSSTHSKPPVSDLPLTRAIPHRKVGAILPEVI